ncbi:transcriptional regulator ATRX homolog [Anabrus simplex]|uniref:transcriptional regulator ATRX homolog n=1 Tax=Anabrus simplex TaxID=316456 RepID=UPI0035A3A2EE
MKEDRLINWPVLSVALEIGDSPSLHPALKRSQVLARWQGVNHSETHRSEARAHGVGYYAFSQEEIERASQQEALNEQRQETERQQQLAKELREKREKQLQARLKAARARNRARLGLPPEEDEPQPGPSAEEQAGTTEDEAAVGKAAEEGEAKATEAPPKADHVRPWDVGKGGPTNAPKIHFEPMSQEEWVQKNRDERIQEFAPVYGNEEEQSSSARPSPWNVDMRQSTLFFEPQQAKLGESLGMATSQEEWAQKNQDERPQEFAPVYGNEEKRGFAGRRSFWNVRRQPSTLFFSSKKAKLSESGDMATSQEERVQKKRDERPQEFAPVYGNEGEHTPSARPSPWNVNRQPSTLFSSSKKARPGESRDMAMSLEERAQKKRDERPQQFAPVYGNEGGHATSAGSGPWIEDRQPSTLFFSSKKAKPRLPMGRGASSSKRISHLVGERVVPQPVVPMKRTKIQNELSCEDWSSSDEDTRGLGAEIAPPPPHVYMMSSPVLPRPSSAPKSEIEKSIEIGLAKLRREYEEKRRRGDERQGGIYDFLPK